jgi:hypothetical protein
MRDANFQASREICCESVFPLDAREGQRRPCGAKRRMRVGNPEKDIREGSHAHPVAKRDFRPHTEAEEAGIEMKGLHRARRLTAIGNKRELVVAQGDNTQRKMVAAEVRVKQRFGMGVLIRKMGEE